MYTKNEIEQILKENVARNLPKFRKVEGMKPKELSLVSGVTTAQIWNLENKRCKVNLGSLILLCLALDKNLSDFTEF